VNIPVVLERLAHRYPSLLVDAVTEHDPGRRIVAVKNVTVSEEFFQGHFPGTPLMPGVLMIESLSQVATLLLFGRDAEAGDRTYLRGVENAKFRRQVVPGDRLQLEVTLAKQRGRVVRAAGVASVCGQVVAEADLVMAIDPAACREARGPVVHPTAVVHPNASIGDGTVIGAYVSIGADVRIGRQCRVGASSVIEGRTEIGDHTQIYPFASI